MISAVICMFRACYQIEFDIFVICPVFMHCLSSFLLQDMFSSLHELLLRETKHEIYREHVAYLHSILWRRARL